MSHLPGLALATEIGAQTSLTLGVDIFNSTLRAADGAFPTCSVFVYQIGGLIPLRTMGELDEIRTAVVFIRVRDSVFATGQLLAQEIMDALSGTNIATYLDVKLTVQPTAQGQDSFGAHLFSLTFAMVYQE